MELFFSIIELNRMWVYMKRRKCIFRRRNIGITKDRLNNKAYLSGYALEKQYFTRNRKFGIKDIVLYELNKRGITSKMEIINFNDITKTEKVSSVAVFKQREKLSPEIFVDLNDGMMSLFYQSYPEEVITYKNYVLLAIDGSDFEIPNTKNMRKEYNGKQQEQCARVTVSTCYDVLNKYTVDTIIENYNHSETDMAIRHYKTIKDKNFFST